MDHFSVSRRRSINDNNKSSHGQSASKHRSEWRGDGSKDDDSGVDPNDSYERSITSMTSQDIGDDSSNMSQDDDEESDSKERRIAEMLNERDLDEEDANAD